MVRVTRLHSGVDFAHGRTRQLQTSREAPFSMLSGPVALVCGLLAWGGQAEHVANVSN